MNKIIDFFSSSYDEMANRVDWPGKGELWGSTVLVMVATVIFSLVIALVDYVFKTGMESIYNYFN